MSRRTVSFVLLSVLLLSVLLVFLVQQDRADPLAEFRTGDGKLVVPGGAFTPALQRLLFPPPAPTTYTLFREVSSSYPTSEIRGFTYDLPKPAPGEAVGISSGFAAGLQSFFTWFFRGLQALDPFMTASAADRFLVLGDGACTAAAIATDADCWSATSGGAGNAGVPGNTDRALLDVASSAGTGTMDAAMDVQEWCSADSCNGAAAAFAGTISTGNFGVTIGTGGYTQASTFTAGSSTIVLNGNWDSSAGTFTPGTSTVVAATSGSYTTNPDGGGENTFTNFTINNGVTMTLANRIGFYGKLTMLGTSTVTGGGVFGVSLYTASDSFDCLSTSTVSSAVLVNSPDTTVDVDCTYGGSGEGLVLNQSQTFTLGGNLVVTNTLRVTDANGGSILAAGANNVTASGGLTVGTTGGLIAALTFTSGILTTGTVVIAGSSTNDYVQFGSGSHTITGTYTNASTTSSWDAGTGTVRFTATATMTFAGTNLAEDEFNNVDFKTSAGGATWTMATRGLRIGGTLRVDSFNGGASLTTSGSNLAITAGSLVLGDISAGGTLTANASTITVNGNWNSSAGTFAQGTSTIVFAASGTFTTGGDNNGAQLNNVTVNLGVTVTLGSSIRVRGSTGLLVVNGTIAMAGLIIRPMIGGSDLTFGASGVLTGTGTIRWSTLSGAAVTLPATTTAIPSTVAVSLEPVSASVFSLSGALTVGALTITNGGGAANLTTTGLNYALTTQALTVESTGILTANASTITVSGNWDSSAGTFTKGTSTVTMSGAAKTVKITGVAGFYDLTVSGTISILTNALDVSNILATSGSGTLTTAGLNITGGATVSLVGTGGITATTSVLTVSDVTVGAGTTLSFTSGSATVSGNWDSSAGTFTFGTSTVTMTGTGKTVKTTFYNLIISGDTTLAAALTVTNTFTVNAVLDTANFAMALKTVVISAAGAMKLGNQSHTVSGTWTNSTTNPGGVWDEDSSTVTFTSATDGTMTFAGTAFDEFNIVVFTSSGAGAQAFTMATNGLRFGGTLTVQDAVGTTELVTAGLAVNNFSSGTLIIGNGGILTATTSSVFVGSVQMTGGTSGIITVTSGAWQLGAVGAFSWDTSGAGSTFTSGTGTVTIGNGGGTPTVKQLAGQGFYNFIVDAGTTATLLSNLEAANALTISATGALSAGNPSFDLTFAALTATGSLSMDGFTMSSSAVTLTTSAGTITLTDWFAYNLANPVDVTWGFNPSAAGATVTMTFSGLPSSTPLALRRDGNLILVVESSVGGSVTFPVTGGWSAHTMAISEYTGGGGGGGGSKKINIVVTQIQGMTYQFEIKDDGTMISVAWNFGDGTTGNGFRVLHTYASAGTYDVNATVQASAWSVTVTKTLTVVYAEPAVTVFSWILFVASVISLLIMLLASGEQLKYRVGWVAVALLAIQFFIPAVLGRTYTGYTLLAAGIVALVITIAPTKKDRIRGAWLVLGATAFILWYVLFFVIGA